MEKQISLVLALDHPATKYSLADAVDLIHKIHLQLEAIEDYSLKLKWWMGCILTHTDRPDGAKTKTVEEISVRLNAEYGLRAGKTLLYQCAKLYALLAGDYQRFLDWIANRKRRFGRPVYWYDVVNDLLGGKNNPAVIGREAADEQDYRDAERALESIEKIIERANRGNEEAAGVLEGFRQTVLGLMLLSPNPSSTPRSGEYLRYVASYACLVCGLPSEPHHAVGRRGKGLKPSDFGCVPLCRDHHEQLHRSGRRAFERFHRTSLLEAAFNLVHRYITGAWLTMELDRVG